MATADLNIWLALNVQSQVSSVPSGQLALNYVYELQQYEIGLILGRKKQLNHIAFMSLGG